MKSDIQFLPLNIPEANLDSAVVSKLNAGGTGNANVIAVTNLAELQAVLTNEIAEIQGAIDLVNTNVTLPANVYIKDGGGSIVSSGTGVLKTQGNSIIDNGILNYQLNWDATSVGMLSSSTFDLNLTKWGIDNTLLGTDAHDTVEEATARLNKDRLNKALTDSKLFGMSTFTVISQDFFVQTNYVDSPLTQQALLLGGASIQIPSGTRFIMSDDTYIRKFAGTYPAGNTISCLEVEDITIEGGNIMGDRTTRMYDQYIRIFTLPTTGTELIFNIGVTGALVEHTITISSYVQATILSEIAAYIDALGGWTAAIEVIGGYSYVVASNNTAGFRERIDKSSNDVSGIAYEGYTNTHEMVAGVTVLSSKRVTIKNVKFYEQSGDGITALINGKIYLGAVNNEQIIIENCYFADQGRMGIAFNSSYNSIIRNNQVYRSGQTLGTTIGTSPASGIWLEPFGTTDANGIATNNTKQDHLLVENNQVWDCRDSAIGTFASYNTIIRGNYTNNTIDIAKGVNILVDGNTIDFNESTDPSTLAISLTVLSLNENVTKNAGVVWERGKNVTISNNTIIGTGVTGERGIVLQGYKVNMHNNKFRNIGGIQLYMSSHLIDSKIHDNYYETDPTILTSTWIDDLGIGKTENVEFYNENVTVYGTTHDLGMNASGTITTGYEIDGLDLTFRNCKFKSISLANHIIRNSKYLTFDNCEWNSKVIITGAINQYYTFRNNIFKGGLEISGTSTAINNSIWDNNIFTATGTTACFSFESRGVSANNVIKNNVFNQPSGAEAMRLWVTGGQHNVYKIYNNILETAGATEFIDATVSGTYFLNNKSLITGAASQTVTLGAEGTANVVN
jgi:hypothetical protein